MIKITKIVLIVCVCFSFSNAQDDVSIMDLKETTYYLMKDVQRMKKEQKAVLDSSKKISMDNIDIIQSLSQEVENLKKQNKALMQKNVLPKYKVSSELSRYIK